MVDGPRAILDHIEWTEERRVDPIGILILDDDLVSQAALWQVLDSEGWQIRMVTHANLAMAELAHGQARLVIANVAMTGLTGPLFETLEALALSPSIAGTRAPARVLYLVPAIAATEAQPVLERAGLPYLLKPYHLHDLLQRVSDLLLEARAISAPIRNVHIEFQPPARPLVRTGTRLDTRRTNMFASREEYSMTEEEMLEYERQEEEVRKKKNRKPGEGQLE
jgi:DNA-binding response OmpR family regulator